MPFKVPFLCSPYVAAAVALVAIGVVVYEVLTSRNGPQSYRRPPPPRQPPPPPSPPPTPPPSKPKRPRSKPKNRGHYNSQRPPFEISSDEGENDSSTSPTEFKDPEIGYVQNNVRKRNVNGSKKNEEESPQKTSSNLDCQNINKSNYEKNVCENILNDITKANKESNLKENLNRNITDEDSDSENNFPEKENNELKIGAAPDCNRLLETKEIYQRNVCETLRGEHREIEEEAVATSESSSHVEHHELNEHINANVTRGICSGCEENPINAEACPCGHRYLCIECFQRVFRIGYRRCSICFGQIEDFKTI